MALFVDWEGEVGDVKNLGSGGDVLVEILEEKCFRVFRLNSYAGMGQRK